MCFVREDLYQPPESTSEPEAEKEPDATSAAEPDASGDPWSFEVDELLPVSRGGSPLDYSNVDAAHRICNQRRGNRMPGDAKQYQIRRTRLF